MGTPFPGMDPYQETPALWPDVHNSLVAAMRNSLGPLLRPRYVGCLEERVEVPVPDPVRETYLVVRAAQAGDVVTVVELLSPTNKRPGEGRTLYEEKRLSVLGSRTSLVEIDLHRGGQRMPVAGAPPGADYTILIRRGDRRIRADLLAFGIRQPIPPFALPLYPGDLEPEVDLGALLHALYETAAYDLRIDYRQNAVPPIGEADREWVDGLLREEKLR
jgi:hypothetical protein